MNGFRRIFFLLILFFPSKYVFSDCPLDVANARSIAAFGEDSAYMIEYIGDKFGTSGYEPIYRLYTWNSHTNCWDERGDEVYDLRQLDVYSDDQGLMGTDDSGIIREWDHIVVAGPPNLLWTEPYGTSETFDWALYEPKTYETLGLVEGFDGLWKTLNTPAPGPGDPWYKYLPAGPDVSDKMKNYWFVDKDAESFTKWERGDIGYAVALNRNYGTPPFNVYYYGDDEEDAYLNIEGPPMGSNVSDVEVRQISYDEVHQNLWCIDVDGVPWRWDNTNQEWIESKSKSCFTVGGRVLVNEDYTIPCSVNGDLIIINGSIKINDPGLVTINGDVKILSGNVYFGPNGGPFRVIGDLIVTNTLPGYHSTIVTHTSLEVTGAIVTRSCHGQAFITTTGGETKGWVEAGAIITSGIEDASVYTGSHLTVAGEIDTHSTTSDALIEVDAGRIEAESIQTNAYNDGYVLADDIFAVGDITTRAMIGDGYVESFEDNVYASNITTSAGGDAYVQGNDGVRVLGSINVTSTGSDAYVFANGTSVTAGSIITNAYDSGLVRARDLILVNGDISTKSSNGTCFVYCDGGPIIAVNVYADAYDFATLDTDGNYDINVRRNINLKSENLHACVLSEGDLFAYNITTSAKEDGYVEAYDSVFVGGVINTSGGVESYVRSYEGDIFAESIFTNSGSAHVLADRDIFVKDIIRPMSSIGDAYVEAGNDIFARSISTSADLLGYVDAIGGSIDVAGDIRTRSGSSHAHVEAAADIVARSIRTTAPAGSNDYIMAGPGSGRFELFVDDGNAELTIENSEFYINSDYVWGTLLSIDGTCTFDGNSCRLELEGAGGILVKSGASLFLKNIKIDNVWGTKIQCADNTATLSLMNVVLTQTGDTIYDVGSIQVMGDVLIGGTSTEFLYEGTATTTVHENSSFIFSHGVTLSYNAGSDQQIWLSEDSSQIKFDGSSLFVSDDIRFTKGILTLDNVATFSMSVGKVCTLGNGNAVYNILIDWVLGTEFMVHGELNDENVYA